MDTFDALMSHEEIFKYIANHINSEKEIENHIKTCLRIECDAFNIIDFFKYMNKKK